ncbi:hypothetical protein AX16_003280 [Volvariella volvacea WC 439]|nr:hypothetical protein AX16_003280 [Volvariella volvacea WC 439]
MSKLTDLEMLPEKDHKDGPFADSNRDGVRTSCTVSVISTVVDPNPPSASEKAPLPDVIEVTFEDGDQSNPINFSRRKKWIISIVASLFTVLAACATTSYTMGIPSMKEELHCTDFQATLGLSLFGVGFAVVPLFTSSFSEEFGRLPLYIVSVLGFALTHLVVAVAQNIETVIVFRTLQGAFGSTGATVVAGTIADIWERKERGLPMTVYSVIAFSGNGIGAVMSGWIEMNPRLGWRWVSGIPCIMSFIYLALVCIFLRETRSSVILTKRAKKIRKETGDDRYRAPAEIEHPSLKTMIWVSCTRPLVFLLTEPIVASVSLWIGFDWGVYWCLIQSIPGVFRTLHNFNSGEIGNVYLTMIVGSVLGYFTNIFQERLYQKNHATRGPEARLYFSCIAGIMFPASMFLFAWTLLPNIHWIVLVIADTLYIWSAFTIYLGLFTYLPDCYGTYASSALAGQSLFRNLTGSVFPLFVGNMFDALTYKWANTMFACIGVILIPIPFALFFFGSKIRAKSKFAI